jgi:hypothetical protein
VHILNCLDEVGLSQDEIDWFGFFDLDGFDFHVGYLHVMIVANLGIGFQSKDMLLSGFFINIV